MSHGDVISLCDESGIAVQDWARAGYTCWLIDIQHPRGVKKIGNLRRVGADVHELYRGHWWLPESAVFACAMPDCTFLTNSGNGWQKRRGPGCVARGLLLADACWRLMIAYGCPWWLENPAVGRLSTSWCRPDFKFHPWQYAGYLPDIQAENTTKETGLWTGGGFEMPATKPAPEPHRHDCWVAPPSDDRREIRSITPAGFARAVFEANARVSLQEVA